MGQEHQIVAYFHGINRTTDDYVGNSSDWPQIGIKFYLWFSREPNSPIVNWDTWDYDYSDVTKSGHFWYMITGGMAINPDDPNNPRDTDDDTNELYYLINKPYHTERGTGDWWNHVTLGKPGPKSVYCTSDKITVYFYVKAQCDCAYNNGTQYCFPSYGPTWYMVDSMTFDIEPYETFYTVDYNPDGGTGSFPNQTKSSLSALTLHPNLPTYPVSINYYNINGLYVSSDTYYRPLGENASHDNTWKGTDNNYYGASGTYSTNDDCTMRAIWRDATFTTRSITDQYYTVTYQYNGGTGSPASVALPRTKSGYATSSGGSVVYSEGQSIDTSVDMSLYPRYGDATLASLPQPTKTGYQFLGWYTSSGTKVTTPYTVTGNITLTARWSALPIHTRLRNGTWDSNGPKVWRMGEDHQWHQVSHVMQVQQSGQSKIWKDLSE